MTDTATTETTAQARTPGAKRAGPGEYYFDITKVNSIMGGPAYSSVFGGCVEGERMIVGLMRMPAWPALVDRADVDPAEVSVFLAQRVERLTASLAAAEARVASIRTEQPAAELVSILVEDIWMSL